MTNPNRVRCITRGAHGLRVRTPPGSHGPMTDGTHQALARAQIMNAMDTIHDRLEEASCAERPPEIIDIFFSENSLSAEARRYISIVTLLSALSLSHEYYSSRPACHTKQFKLAVLSHRAFEASGFPVTRSIQSSR